MTRVIGVAMTTMMPAYRTRGRGERPELRGERLEVERRPNGQW